MEYQRIGADLDVVHLGRMVRRDSGAHLRE